MIYHEKELTTFTNESINMFLKICNRASTSDTMLQLLIKLMEYKKKVFLLFFFTCTRTIVTYKSKIVSDNCQCLIEFSVHSIDLGLSSDHRPIKVWIP